MPWYIFAFGTAFFYSISIFIDKYLIEKQIKNPYALTSLFSMTTGIVGIAIGFITGFKYIGITQTGIIIFAGMLLSLYLLPYLKAIKIDDASQVVPLFQLIPIFTLVMSWIFLGETLRPKQIVGLLIVVVAAIVLSMDKIDKKIFRPRKSLWYMILSSFMYGAIGILFRFTVKHVDYWTTISYEYIGTGLAGVLLFFIPQIRNSLISERKAIVKSVGFLGADKVLGVCANLAEGFAMSLVAVPLVNVVESVQPFLTLVLGIAITLWFPYLIKENISKKTITHKLVSIVFIFLGMVLVYT